MQGCSPRPLRALAFTVSIAISAALAGCKTEESVVEKPNYTHQLADGECALRKLDPGKWPDVGAAWRMRDPNLTTAAERSIAWFGLPSSASHFPFMSVCTADQAGSSVVAFHQLLADSKDEASFVAALRQKFDVWQTVGWNGEGVVLFTGYYSPIFKGSLTQTGEFKYPLHKRPADLVTDAVTGEPKGRKMPDGSVQPWPARKQIEDSQMLKGTELVWLSSPLDAYIIQVNGSAKITLPDGKDYYVGYAGKTDRAYKGLGASVVEAGLIPKDQVSLKAIVDLYKKQPAKVQELMWKNDSYVFFQEYDGTKWPSGSLGFKVTDRTSLATDKKVYPRGGVVLVDTQGIDVAGQKTRFLRYMLDQDTGGAIKAPGRADIYMGVGEKAETLAGGQLAEGTMYYLFLKPEFVSQYPVPVTKKGAAKAEPQADGKAAKGGKQQGLKPAKGGDANK